MTYEALVTLKMIAIFRNSDVIKKNLSSYSKSTALISKKLFTDILPEKWC